MLHSLLFLFVKLKLYQGKFKRKQILPVSLSVTEAFKVIELMYSDPDIPSSFNWISNALQPLCCDSFLTFLNGTIW